MERYFFVLDFLAALLAESCMDGCFVRFVSKKKGVLRQGSNIRRDSILVDGGGGSVFLGH